MIDWISWLISVKKSLLELMKGKTGKRTSADWWLSGVLWIPAF